MKTLIIHPKDQTTDFLKVIHKDYTVFDFDGNISIEEAIESHDKIIMLGHGYPDGLFDTYQGSFVIDESLTQLLKDKICVGIWCYAAEFLLSNCLKGLCTGMFISEMEEAIWESVECTEEDIQQSNELFANLIAKIEPLSNRGEIRKHLDEMYCIPENNVIEYNRNRIYFID